MQWNEQLLGSYEFDNVKVLQVISPRHKGESTKKTVIDLNRAGVIDIKKLNLKKEIESLFTIPGESVEEKDIFTTLKRNIFEGYKWFLENKFTRYGRTPCLEPFFLTSIVDDAPIAFIRECKSEFIADYNNELQVLQKQCTYKSWMPPYLLELLIDETLLDFEKQVSLQDWKKIKNFEWIFIKKLAKRDGKRLLDSYRDKYDYIIHDLDRWQQSINWDGLAKKYPRKEKPLLTFVAIRKYAYQFKGEEIRRKLGEYIKTHKKPNLKFITLFLDLYAIKEFGKSRGLKLLITIPELCKIWSLPGEDRVNERNLRGKLAFLYRDVDI